MPPVVVGPALELARSQGSIGWRAVESLDLRLLVDAEHEGAVGWVEVEPDDVAHLLDQLRVGGELEVLAAVGCKPKARQIRCTLVWLSPLVAAIDRVLQCVASRGVDSKVFTTTASTPSSLIRRVPQV